jgi:hypothetical protein
LGGADLATQTLQLAWEEDLAAGWQLRADRHSLLGSVEKQTAEHRRELREEQVIGTCDWQEAACKAPYGERACLCADQQHEGHRNENMALV